VKFWSLDKGFGFIERAEGGEDLFAHFSSLPMGVVLSAGQRISYAVGWNARREKWWAIDIEIESEEEGSEAEVVDRQEVGTVDSSGERRSDSESVAARQEGEGGVAGPSVTSQNRVGQPAALLEQLRMQTLDQQQQQHQMLGSVAPAVSQPDAPSAPQLFLQQLQMHIEPIKVEPLQVPQGASIDQRMDLMMAHMEQLRLQGAQNQQLLLQGMYAMLQQQTIQNANLERALLTLADRVGAPVGVPVVGADVQLLGHGKTPMLQQNGSHLNARPVAEPIVDSHPQQLHTPHSAQGSINEDDVRLEAVAVNTQGAGMVQQVEVMNKADLKGEAATSSNHEIAGDNEEGKEDTATRCAVGSAESLQMDMENNRAHENIGGMGDDRHKVEKEDGREELGVVSENVDLAQNGHVLRKGTEWVEEQTVDSSRQPHDNGPEDPVIMTLSPFRVVGSFNGWSVQSEPMSVIGGAVVASNWLAVRRDAPKIGGSNKRREEFQILGDEGNWDKRIFPRGGEEEEIVLLDLGSPRPSPAAQSGDRKGNGHGRNWAVDERPGTSFRIIYDTEAKTVSCEARPAE